MKLEWTFLRSKVARRILLLFVLCALLPIAALAIISFGQVTKELNGQSQRRLHQASKAAALSIYERLLFLEAEMRMVARTLTTGTATSTLKGSDLFGEGLPGHFISLALISSGGRHRVVYGRTEDLPELTAAEKQHMTVGKTLLSSRVRSDLPSRMFMAMALDPQQPAQGILLGEINPQYLWGVGDENTLPPMTELCVLDHSVTVLICSLPGRISFPERVTRNITRSASGWMVARPMAPQPHLRKGPSSPSPGKDFRDTDTAAPHQGQGTPPCSLSFMPDSTAIPTRAVPKTHLPQGVHPTSHAGRERPTDAARGRQQPATLSTSTRSGPLTGLTHVPRADKIP